MYSKFCCFLKLPHSNENRGSTKCIILMYHNLYIGPLMNIQVVCIFMFIFNNAAVNICVNIFFCGHIYSVLFGIFIRVELLDHMVNCTFNFLKTCQTVSQSGYIILQSHQPRLRVPFSPHGCQYFLMSIHPCQRCIVVSLCGFDLRLSDG